MEIIRIHESGKGTTLSVEIRYFAYSLLKSYLHTTRDTCDLAILPMSTTSFNQ